LSYPSWCTVIGDTIRGIAECEYVDTSFTITAFDGTLADTLFVSLIIDHSNQPPEIIDPDSQVNIKNQHAFTYYPSISDPDDITHDITYPWYPHWCFIQGDTVKGTAPSALYMEPLTVIVEDYCNADTLSFMVSTYLCGDGNHDGQVNISDAVWIINYVFVGGNPPNPLDSGDANCDGTVNISDAVWIINYVFVGGNIPCDTDGDSIPDC